MSQASRKGCSGVQACCRLARGLSGARSAACEARRSWNAGKSPQSLSGLNLASHPVGCPEEIWQRMNGMRWPDCPHTGSRILRLSASQSLLRPSRRVRRPRIRQRSSVGSLMTTRPPQAGAALHWGFAISPEQAVAPPADGYQPACARLQSAPCPQVCSATGTATAAGSLHPACIQSACMHSQPQVTPFLASLPCQNAVRCMRRCLGQAQREANRGCQASCWVSIAPRKAESLLALPPTHFTGSQ